MDTISSGAAPSSSGGEGLASGLAAGNPEAPAGSPEAPAGDRKTPAGDGEALRSVTAELLARYDRPGPRYTSYPTAVEFNESFDDRSYVAKLEEAAAAPGEPISLYAHLPFCEERCSFCGCMVIITRKSEVSVRYLEYLHREIAMLAARLKDRK